MLGAIVAQFVAVGMQGQVSGIFLRPMTEDLGWTRSEFTIATSLGTGVTGLIGFFIGAYIDRVGARPLMVTGITIVGATLIAISRVEELWEFIVLRGIAFTVGFVLIGNLVVNVTVSKWFVERRGWAISMASLGVSVAGIAMPLVMVPVVDAYGWRDGWVIMGVAAWVLIYPVALIMRRQPEDYGLLPDGKVEGDVDDAASVAAARRDFDNSYTRGQAVRTLSMWLLVIAFGFAAVGLISILFHSIPFLTDAGFTRRDASFLAASQGGAALISKFAWGWAMQRFHPRALAALSFLISGGAALAMVPIAHLGSRDLMFVAFVTWGWGIGGMIPLSEFIWASFFGRRHLGAVRGAALPVTILFSAGGPLFAGVYFDRVGSYDGAFVTFASLWFVATLLIMFARQPKPKAMPPPAVVTPDSPAAFFEPGADIDVPPSTPEPAAPAVANAAPAPPVPPAVPTVASPVPPAVPPPTSRPEPAPAMAAGAADQPAGDEPAEEPEEIPVTAPTTGSRTVIWRPRDYMSGEDAAELVPDYMNKQIDAPQEAPSADAAPVASTNGGSSATAAEPPPEPPLELPADSVIAAPAPEPEPRPMPDFDEFDGEAEPEPVPEPEPVRERVRSAETASQFRPPPGWTPPRKSLPGGASDGGLRRSPSLNLGSASRALQKRLPGAVSYYRRDGVSSAVMAGVATSVAVTAAAWMLSRNAKR
ncbi:MAG TPA: MFS transporter [Dehalococcoidia bacterium]|nr:MFS transporter [Dehalococcoidia bacterium]